MEETRRERREAFAERQRLKRFEHFDYGLDDGIKCEDLLLDRSNHHGEPARFEHLETDRAELIRKIDELKDTLYRVQQGPCPGNTHTADSRRSYYPRQWPSELISYKPEASYSYGCDNIVSHNYSRRFRENVGGAPFLSDRRSELDYYRANLSEEKLLVPKRRDEISWRPIAGGAPILACSNCFELLKIPEKRMALLSQKKVKCGSCSSIILLVSSVSGDICEDRRMKDECNEVYQNSSDSRACCNDAPGRRFSPKEEKETLENIQSSKKISCELSELCIAAESESTVNLDSFCQETSGIQRSEFEKKASVDESRGNSLTLEGLDSSSKATEINVSLSELPNSSTSHESEEKSGDGNNSDQISRNAQSNVFVNGHLIPYHDVKKAEELSGPIQPGEYWYDSTAGFWGVMGHPCLGMIMPNIEEFNYPMAENCAAGNTGVYVNGRELYEKDMNLLTRRGLPHTRNRSYIVFMSGKVINEQTGQELASLGKLAPSVERAGHGFGMKVPRFITRLQIR